MNKINQTSAIDPVCGMMIPPDSSKYQAEFRGRIFSRGSILCRMYGGYYPDKQIENKGLLVRQ
jgi:hypothetical protein